MDTEEGCTLFCTCHSLVLSKGLLCVSTMPKGEAEGILAFVVPTAYCCTALNGFHHDVGHQGQQRTSVLAQEQFWWLMTAEHWYRDASDAASLREWYLKPPCVPSGHIHCWNSSTLTSPAWSPTNCVVSKMCW